MHSFLFIILFNELGTHPLLFICIDYIHDAHEGTTLYTQFHSNTQYPFDWSYHPSTNEELLFQKIGQRHV